jgi:RNase P subunit RPR2
MFWPLNKDIMYYDQVAEAEDMRSFLTSTTHPSGPNLLESCSALNTQLDKKNLSQFGQDEERSLRQLTDDASSRTCPTCNKVLISKSNLRRHIRDVHQVELIKIRQLKTILESSQTNPTVSESQIEKHLAYTNWCHQMEKELQKF